MRRLASVWLLALAACTDPASNPPALGGQKDEDAGKATEDEAADRPAPVSGAYLTCMIPRPKEGQDTLEAGCVMFDGKNEKVDLSRRRNLWTYKPPVDKSLPEQKIEVVSLADQGKNYFFHAVYRIKVPKGTGLAQAPQLLTERFFFESSPAYDRVVSRETFGRSSARVAQNPGKIPTSVYATESGDDVVVPPDNAFVPATNVSSVAAGSGSPTTSTPASATTSDAVVNGSTTSTTGNQEGSSTTDESSEAEGIVFAPQDATATETTEPDESEIYVGFNPYYYP